MAIVGPTGAGKTTLVNLLMRFYEVDSGQIFIDGVDISSVSRYSLRSRMGMVLQDTWLFGGTIFDNIAYGRPEAGEDEVIAAAKAAFVDRFVHTLPDGYETRVSDDGGNISAGEKQLITIARAFLARPQLLILDEATSSVDTRTELLIAHATAELRRDRTSFIIAHRLSTIRDADHILVIEAGRIVERGSHAELLARHGEYWAMTQFEGGQACSPCRNRHRVAQRPATSRPGRRRPRLGLKDLRPARRRATGVLWRQPQSARRKRSGGPALPDDRAERGVRRDGARLELRALGAQVVDLRHRLA